MIGNVRLKNKVIAMIHFVVYVRIRSITISWGKIGLLKIWLL